MYYECSKPFERSHCTHMSQAPPACAVTPCAALHTMQPRDTNETKFTKHQTRKGNWQRQTQSDSAPRLALDNDDAPATAESETSAAAPLCSNV